MKSYLWEVLLSYFQLHEKSTVMTWMHVEKKNGTVFVSLVSTLCWKTNLYDLSRRYSFPYCPAERFFYLICLINPICGKYSLHAGNLILMICGVSALSLGLTGNVVCDRFRLAWFVTQAL